MKYTRNCCFMVLGFFVTSFSWIMALLTVVCVADTKRINGCLALDLKALVAVGDKT
jgi:hypothetical protein